MAGVVMLNRSLPGDMFLAIAALIGIFVRPDIRASA